MNDEQTKMNKIQVPFAQCMITFGNTKCKLEMLFVTYAMITHSGMADQNVSHSCFWSTICDFGQPFQE